VAILPRKPLSAGHTDATDSKASSGNRNAAATPREPPPATTGADDRPGWHPGGAKRAHGGERLPPSMGRGVMSRAPPLRPCWRRRCRSAPAAAATARSAVTIMGPWWNRWCEAPQATARSLRLRKNGPQHIPLGPAITLGLIGSGSPRPAAGAPSLSPSNGASPSSLPRWRSFLSMLNWRRDPDYEQMRQENARLRLLNARTKTLLSCVDQQCFPPESSSIPRPATGADDEPSSP